MMQAFYPYPPSQKEKERQKFKMESRPRVIKYYKFMSLTLPCHLNLNKINIHLIHFLLIDCCQMSNFTYNKNQNIYNVNNIDKNFTFNMIIHNINNNNNNSTIFQFNNIVGSMSVYMEFHRSLLDAIQMINESN